jgi:hypothetical protein
VAAYCFVPASRKAEFSGVPSGAIVSFGCAVSKKGLRNTGLLSYQLFAVPDRQFLLHSCAADQTHRRRRKHRQIDKSNMSPRQDKDMQRASLLSSMLKGMLSF